jgi:GNAT superfamily N-acetyltransferase
MIDVREHQASGLEHLALVTTLLQSARRANPHGGVWEAADLQWSWRRDQHPDPSASTFWIGDDGTAEAAVVFTDWGDHLGCDVLHVGHDSAAALAIVGGRLEAILDTRADAKVEMTIRSDDPALLAAAAALGFVVTEELEMTTTMAAGERPPVGAPPDGFVVESRATRADRPHHMIGRSGADVAERLLECSIYRPDLDLCVVETATGTVAAYGLFWADLVTGVGLVEPMRTEDAYQGRRLASTVLRAGLDRLATAGCDTLRITYQARNEPARRAYIGAGFRPWSECRTYRRASPR